MGLSSSSLVPTSKLPEDEARLFTAIHGEGINDIRQIEAREVQTRCKERLFHLRTVRQWHKLPREAM